MVDKIQKGPRIMGIESVEDVLRLRRQLGDEEFDRRAKAEYEGVRDFVLKMKEKAMRKED